ncbi:MAG TPA: choice-of-anchor Q domain-containing protein, partial [Cyclobacteriaceae bacterium]|nr:choice-of-anchor Q domain-containing protein [Cyclobacteriaceae bacterium]
VINPKEEGIAIYSFTLPSNVCINNIIVNPGTFSTYKESAYIRINKNAPTEKSNNYTTLTIGDVKFVNSKNNFRLKTGSPAIDKGKDISSYVISKDFYDNERHKGSAYDIGASEF